MRRLPNRTNQGKLSQKRLEARRFERRLESARKAQLRRRVYSGAQHGAVLSRFAAPHVTRGSPATIELTVPAVLDLSGNHDESAEFFRDIRRLVAIDGQHVGLNFDNVTDIKPLALLRLLAEIDMRWAHRGRGALTGNYPRDSRIEEMLQRTGFFRLLKIGERKSLKPRKYPLEYIRFHSGTKASGEDVKKFRQALLGEDIKFHTPARKRFFRAVTEAMLNATQHAYTRSHIAEARVSNKWWLHGRIDKRRRQMMITFCDLGVGIPATLPRLYSWERIREVLATIPGIKPNDGQMIMAGMTIGRTQTGRRSRGKGLNDMRMFIEQAGDGQLQILSRKGLYQYSPKGGERVQNFYRSVGGTLIEWRVPIDAVIEWSGDDDDDIQSAG